MRLSRSIVGEAEARAVSRVITEDGYLGMGNEVRLFEEEVARYLGVKPSQVISVNTGTAALHLAVDGVAAQCRVDGKPEVLVPSLTFVASFQAITAAGCQPVACDVLPETGTIDLADAERRLTPRTIAIMWSYAPSRMPLKPLMVSSSFTYWPGVPVKVSATWKGCERKR